MSTPRISIIIPVYNVPEKYLRECIESCLTQTEQNLELVLVDNQSSDGSWNICQEYVSNDERVVAFRTPGYRGPNWSRRDGVFVACAEFVVFSDADDWLDENYLEELLHRQSETGAEVVQAKPAIEWENYTEEHPQPRDITARGVKEVLEYLFAEDCAGRITVWAKLFTTKVLRAINWWWMTGYEDASLVAEAGAHSQSLAATNATCYHWRQRASSGWSGNFANRAKRNHNSTVNRDTDRIARLLKSEGVKVPYNLIAFGSVGVRDVNTPLRYLNQRQLLGAASGYHELWDSSASQYKFFLSRNLKTAKPGPLIFRLALDFLGFNSWRKLLVWLGKTVPRESVTVDWNTSGRIAFE